LSIFIILYQSNCTIYSNNINTSSYFTNPVVPSVPIISTLLSVDIIGTDGTTGLVKYDENGQLLEHSFYCKEDNRSRVAVYAESLLSLPGDNDQY